MSMRNETCVETHTSTVPTGADVSMSIYFYSVIMIEHALLYNFTNELLIRFLNALLKCIELCAFVEIFC